MYLTNILFFLSIEAGPSRPGPSRPGPSRPGPSGQSRAGPPCVCPRPNPENSQAGPSGTQKSGRLGKGKAKNPYFRKEDKAKNDEKADKAKNDEKADKAKNDEKAKTERILKMYKDGKIPDLKMRRMGFFRNGEMEIKVTSNPWNIELIFNTPDGRMSAAQYRQTYCRNGQEELTRYVIFIFYIK